MSTRYVWDIYDKKTVYEKVQERVDHVDNLLVHTNLSYAAAMFQSYTMSDDNRLFVSNDPTWVNSPADKKADSLRFMMLEGTDVKKPSISQPRMFCNEYQDEYSEPLYWLTANNRGGNGYYMFTLIAVKESERGEASSPNWAQYARDFSLYTTNGVDAQGPNKIGTVSSGTSGFYPEDGASRQKWYSFKGSDSIDPLGIAYSSSKPERGEAVAVTVDVPSNNLGGNISYLYQYSVNGGSTWVSAGSATAEIQKEITVPDNAEQFMARVRAQDDIGFVSADYVTGANLEVQTMHLWVGVDGIARRGRKLWVGVNGVAHPVVRGWVGDANGKAKRWF